MIRRAKPSVHVGWREWIALPDFGVRAIKAKIDTGARTSAIHAWNIDPFERDGRYWVRFQLHPIQGSSALRRCEAELSDQRKVRNSGGKVEQRFIIETNLRLGDESWPIELSLASRDEMGFRLLLGRTALAGHVLVDPRASFVLGVPKRTKKRLNPPLIGAEKTVA